MPSLFASSPPLLPRHRHALAVFFQVDDSDKRIRNYLVCPKSWGEAKLRGYVTSRLKPAKIFDGQKVTFEPLQGADDAACVTVKSRAAPPAAPGSTLCQRAYFEVDPDEADPSDCRRRAGTFAGLVLQGMQVKVKTDRTDPAAVKLYLLCPSSWVERDVCAFLRVNLHPDISRLRSVRFAPAGADEASVALAGAGSSAAGAAKGVVAAGAGAGAGAAAGGASVSTASGPIPEAKCILVYLKGQETNAEEMKAILESKGVVTDTSFVVSNMDHTPLFLVAWSDIEVYWWYCSLADRRPHITSAHPCTFTLTTGMFQQHARLGVVIFNTGIPCSLRLPLSSLNTCRRNFTA